MDAAKPEFERIHQDYRPRIQRYLARLVGENEAEDLTQEVFVKVGRGLKDFRGESTLSTWIYRIATHAAIDWLRRPAQRWNEQGLPAEDTEQGGSEFTEGTPRNKENLRAVEQQVYRSEMNECIRAFILGLPEDYRTVLVLGELEGFKGREIAEILGISLSNVKIRLHRARAMLRAELESHCEAYWVEGNEFLPDLKSAFQEYKQSH